MLIMIKSAKKLYAYDKICKKVLPWSHHLETPEITLSRIVRGHFFLKYICAFVFWQQSINKTLKSKSWLRHWKVTVKEDLKSESFQTKWIYFPPQTSCLLKLIIKFERNFECFKRPSHSMYIFFILNFGPKRCCCWYNSP